MSEFDRIDVFQWIDVNKTNFLHQCIICHYWFFLEINFRFEIKIQILGIQWLLLYNAISYEFNNATIVPVKWNDYRIHFSKKSKDETINIMKHSDLEEKSNIIILYFLK